MWWQGGSWWWFVQAVLALVLAAAVSVFALRSTAGFAEYALPIIVLLLSVAGLAVLIVKAIILLKAEEGSEGSGADRYRWRRHQPGWTKHRGQGKATSMKLSRVLRRLSGALLVAAPCLLILTNPPVTDWGTNILRWGIEIFFRATLGLELDLSVQ